VNRIIKLLALTVALGAWIGVEAPTALAQQPQADDRIADLVKVGELRVALGLGTPISAVKEPTTGELRGLALEMGRALAARMGVKLVTVIYPRTGAIIDGLRTNAWDVSFLGVDPERTAQVDFAHPHAQSDYTLLVSSASLVRNVADADQPGIRIASLRGDASDFYLSRTLKNAQLIRTDTHEAALELVRTGGADAKASARSVLMADSTAIPGSRVLDDGFSSVSFAAVVPKGQAARLAYINDFIDDTKASGSVKRAIESVGLQGMWVAPAEKLGDR
jgi:polar amino acid transport system substrate-binding protein